MFNWRELPFVRLLLALVAGILTSFYFNFDHPGFIAVTLFLLMPVWLFKKMRGNFKTRWLFGAVGYIVLFWVGYHSAYLHDDRNSPGHFGHHISEKENILLGEVNDAPIKKGKWVRVKISVKKHGTATDSLRDCDGNLLAYFSRDAASEAIEYGDILCFQARPTELDAPKNPHSFDYKRYLHFQNIHYQAFARQGQWRVLEKGKGNAVFSMAIALQERFLNTLRKHLTTEKELAVGSALILGYRDEIPEEVQTAYSQTGAMHVLAVSGLHVGIVFLLIDFFLKKIKNKARAWRIAKVLIVLAVIWAFALVTGASPSVMRAAVMFSFLNVGLAFKRFSNIYNTLAASAFFMLVYDPHLIASVGFQLSYLAVFGIVYFQPKIAGLWKAKTKFGNYIWQLACVSLAAQIMTLPLAFYYFNQLPVYFWLTGLIMVPLAGFELGAGLALLLFEAISPPLAVWVGKLLYGMLWLGNECVFLIQQLPAAVIEGIWLAGAVALVLYLAITSTMMAISSRKYRWIIMGLGAFMFVSLNFAFTGIKHRQSRQMVVYSIYKHSAIDFFDGKKVYSLTDQNMDVKSHGFATQGHRYAMGGKNTEDIFLEGTGAKTFGCFFYENGFVQFHHLKLAIFDGTSDLNGRTKMEVDYLLLRNSPKIVVDELVHVFDFEKIIFDASNKKWQVEKWKKQCLALGVTFYDVNEAGAFVLDLE